MHLAQVVSFVSLCATRTWKNWKTPSTLNTVSYRVCRGGLRLQLGAAPREVHGEDLLEPFPESKLPVAYGGHVE